MKMFAPQALTGAAWRSFPTPMTEWLYRLFLLLAITVVTGGIGVLFGAALPGIRPGFIPRLALGLAGILTIMAGLGVLGVRIDRVSLLIGVGILLLCGALVVLIKRRQTPGLGLFVGREEAWLLVLFLLLLAARLIEIRNLFVPNWVDGLIHVSILEKLTLKGAVPAARIYHSGFHAGAMFVQYLFGTSLSDAVLLFGQWASLLAGLTFYDFLRRDKLHFSFAFLGTITYGTILLFPSQLTAWGRYPFLLGLALVFPAITASLDWIDGKRSCLAAFMFVGALALSHYGSLLVWFAFLAAHFMFGRWVPAAAFRRWLLRASLLVLPLLLVLLPKGLNFLGNEALRTSLLSGAGNPDFGRDVQVTLALIQKHDLPFLLFCLFALVGAATLKWRLPARTTAWPILVFLLVWAQYLLLGFSVTSYTNAIIFSSAPVVILFAHALQRRFIWERRSHLVQDPRRAAQVRDGFLFALLAASSLLGLVFSLGRIPPSTTFFTREDVAAIRWIQAHTAPDATFLIQSFIWGDEIKPSDGGGWIPLLTGRRVVYPTAIGELRDVAGYASEHQVDYIYFGREYDPNFTIRLTDVNVPYRIVFGSNQVTILELESP